MSIPLVRGRAAPPCAPQGTSACPAFLCAWGWGCGFPHCHGAVAPWPSPSVCWGTAAGPHAPQRQSRVIGAPVRQGLHFCPLALHVDAVADVVLCSAVGCTPQKSVAATPPPPCVTFCRVAALRGPRQSPVLPSACCVGSLRSVGRCGRCSCWSCFRVRGAQRLVCWGCWCRFPCGFPCNLPPSCATVPRGGGGRRSPNPPPNSSTT